MPNEVGVEGERHRNIEEEVEGGSIITHERGRGINSEVGRLELKGGGRRKNLKCPVEKIEGGLMVAGVVVAENCQIILPVFGFLFLLIGCVLTAASYRGPADDEDLTSYEARISFTGNSRILGPICIVFGIVMLLLGCILCVLTQRAKKRRRAGEIVDEEEKNIGGFHCHLHGDFYYPLTPVSSSSSRNIENIEKEKTNICTLCWFKSSNNKKRRSSTKKKKKNKKWLNNCDGIKSGKFFEEVSTPPKCPHDQCPTTPLPFLVNNSNITNGSVVAAPPAASLTMTTTTPDQVISNFGSIRSLSLTGGGEVASFPLSPPTFALTNFNSNSNLVEEHDNFEKVENDEIPVKIVLPTEL